MGDRHNFIEKNTRFSAGVNNNGAEVRFGSGRTFRADNSDEANEQFVRSARVDDKTIKVAQGATAGFFAGGLTGGGIGAGVGAVIGSIVPGPGTLVGAAVGATIGGAVGAGTLGGVGVATGATVAAVVSEDD